MAIPINNLINQLQAKPTGSNKWQAWCPAHDDRQASLSIGIGDNGNILLHCHAGCELDEICAAAKIKKSDLFAQSSKKTERRIVKTYDYIDSNGAIVYQVARYEPKDFRQRRPDGHGGWIWNLKGVERILYNLPQIKATQGPVWIVEGEKDADNLTALGLTATTNVGGCKKWNKAFSKRMMGRKVIICPDNDDPGRQHAQKVAESLSEFTNKIKILQLPDLPEKGDISDWINAGGTKEQLLKLAGDCLAWQPSADAGVEKPKTKQKTGPLGMALNFLKEQKRVDDIFTIKRWRGDWYEWIGTHYQLLSIERLRGQLYDYFANQHPTQRFITQIIDALAAAGDLFLQDELPVPSYIDGYNTDTPPDRFVAVRNGLIDLQTKAIAKHHPRLFSLDCLPFDSVADDFPETWWEFLNSIWPEDGEAIVTLQQWFGYCLTHDTSQQKILLLIGPKRSGKSTIASILADLLGELNVAWPTLSSLYGNFGLSPLLNKKLAIIPDARLSGRADQAVIVERLLSISGNDRLVIDRKHSAPLAGVQLGCRIMLLTNELPSLTDSSGALPSRFIPLRMDRTFFGSEDLGLLDNLRDELPKILNWAITGWQILNEAKRFKTPETGQEVLEDFYRLSSPVQAFIDDYCTIDPSLDADKDKLYECYITWCDDQGFTRTKTKNVFFRDLKAAIPHIGYSRPRNSDGSRSNFINGLGIKVEFQTGGGLL